MKQGCILSPKIFSLVMSELSFRLLECGAGYQLDDNSVLPGLLVADDVFLISESPTDLQKLLDVAYSVGVDLGLKFSSDKTRVMKLNDATVRNWALGPLDVLECQEYVYLGVTLESNKTIFKKHKDLTIAKANKLCGWVKHIAYRSHNKYLIGRTLWKSVAVPAITYGNELILGNVGYFSNLNTIQNRLGRFLLGGNKLSPLIACHGDMGWSNFEDRDASSKLKYLGRLVFMSDERIAKSLYKLNYGSPLALTWEDQAEYYDSEITVHINNKVAWDKLISASVKMVSANLFHEVVETFTTLCVYSCKTQPKVENLYDNTKGSALLFQARSGSLPLNSRTHHWNGFGKACRVCTSGIEESLQHFFFECPLYSTEREELLKVLHNHNKIGPITYLDAIRSLLGFFKPSDMLISSTKFFLASSWKKRQDSLPAID